MAEPLSRDKYVNECDRMGDAHELVQRGLKFGGLENTGAGIYYHGVLVARSEAELEQMVRDGEPIGLSLNTEYGDEPED